MQKVADKEKIHAEKIKAVEAREAALEQASAAQVLGLRRLQAEKATLDAQVTSLLAERDSGAKAVHNPGTAGAERAHADHRTSKVEAIRSEVRKTSPHWTKVSQCLGLQMSS